MATTDTTSEKSAASRRLSPLDAAFLYFERPTQLLHVGCLALLGGTPPFDELAAVIGGRLARLERYRQVPVRPVLDWGLPVWTADPHFDPRRHIRHVAIPSPSDEDALGCLVDDLFASPLPPDRPPWEMTLVSGLPAGRSALVTKVHHCMIDGVSGAQVLQAIADPHDGEPAASPPVGGAPRPSSWRRALEGLAATVTKLDLHTIAEMGSTLASFVREPISTLPFNASLSPARRMVWTSLPLDDFLAIRGAAGCKINDAVLAVIAGALRRYLAARGIEPEGLRVRAGVPVSVRRSEDRLTLGNLVSAVFPRLPLEVADPAERLRRVAAEMNALKARQQAQATGLMLELLGSLPAPLEALMGRLLPDAPLVNTICTNVPGPRESCSLLGVRIAEVHPFVPLFQSMGLEFAILSYADRLSISAAVDPALVPDAAALPEALCSSLAELRAAVGVDERAPRPPAGRASGPTVGSLMSRPVLTLDPLASLERAWLLMTQARVRHLPVVDDDGRLVGLVTQRDLLAVAPSRVRVPDERTRLSLLAASTARDVMETHLVVARAEDDAASAGDRMVRGKIGALPVVDAGGRLVGILTTDDLVRWAASHMHAAA